MSATLPAILFSTGIIAKSAFPLSTDDIASSNELHGSVLKFLKTFCKLNPNKHLEDPGMI